MAGTSLAEVVIERTALIAELLKQLKIDDSEENLGIFMQIAVANDQAFQMACRRASTSDIQRIKRTQAVRALNPSTALPKQRG